MRIKLMAAVTLFSALAAGLLAGNAYAGAVPEASRPHGEPLCTRCGAMEAVGALGRQSTPTRAVFTRQLPNERAERGAVSVHERQLARFVKSDPTQAKKEALAFRHRRVIPLGGDVLDQRSGQAALVPGALDAAHDLQQTALGAKLRHPSSRIRTEQLSERHFHPRPAPGNPM